MHPRAHCHMRAACNSPWPSSNSKPVCCTYMHQMITAPGYTVHFLDSIGRILCFQPILLCKCQNDIATCAEAAALRRGSGWKGNGHKAPLHCCCSFPSSSVPIQLLSLTGTQMLHSLVSQPHMLASTTLNAHQLHITLPTVKQMIVHVRAVLLRLSCLVLPYTVNFTCGSSLFLCKFLYLFSLPKIGDCGHSQLCISPLVQIPYFPAIQ